MNRTFRKLSIALITTGMLFGGGSLAFAKGGHHGKRHDMFSKLEKLDEQERLEFLEDKLDKRIERMEKHLELTPQQSAKARQIMSSAQTQLLDVWERNKDADDKSAARKEARAIMKASKTEVHALLTPAQQTKVQQMRGERAERRKGKMLERLDEKLDLTATQKVEVEKILEASHTELKALRDTERKQKRQQARAIFEASANDINAVLNPEQQVEFAKLREKMKEKAQKRRGKRGQKTHGPYAD